MKLAGRVYGISSENIFNLQIDTNTLQYFPYKQELSWSVKLLQVYQQAL
jgi:hypothetical protein